MLEFSSSSNGLTSTKEAVKTALLDASGERNPTDCHFIAVHLSMGHDHTELLKTIREHCPNARIAGCTCAGIIGREGANETMRAVAIMMVWGDKNQIALSHTDQLDGGNSREAAAQLARELHDAQGKPQFVMFLASGIDVDTTLSIEGIESVLTDEVTIFGGTSADNMKGIASFQFVDDKVYEHAAMLIGFYDPTLAVHTQASHGFVAAGVEMKVTRSQGNRVHEIDGKPAWETYTSLLGLPSSATPADTIPPGAVGVKLSPELAAEYGDTHLLRVITHREPDGTLLMPVICPEGTTLSLMLRDEERIFANLDVMMRQIKEALGERKIVAVFHADCGARGRLTLDRVAKDEIVREMQQPLFGEQTGPWLGMYGFGEFARLGGKNEFHNYTTALYIITRG